MDPSERDITEGGEIKAIVAPAAKAPMAIGRRSGRAFAVALARFSFIPERTFLTPEAAADGGVMSFALIMCARSSNFKLAPELGVANR